MLTDPKLRSQVDASGISETFSPPHNNISRHKIKVESDRNSLVAVTFVSDKSGGVVYTKQISPTRLQSREASS
jgi:hypothetical protein